MSRTEIVTCPSRKMPPIMGKVVCGDNCDVMGRLPDECIDLVVTSPPYDNLRTYGGHTWDFYGVAWQLKRILKPGGVIVWIVADATIDGNETGSSMRQVLHYKELGLNLHDTMIWRKMGQGACGSLRSYTQNWEYMAILTKGRPRTFNPIEDRKNVVSAGTVVVGSNTNGRVHGRRTIQRRATGRRCNEWQIDPQKNSAHPAPFPEALVADHIKSWSNEGDLVLDPFNGSGTTTKMACILKRHFIGIDINAEYCHLAAQRMGEKGFFV